MIQREFRTIVDNGKSTKSIASPLAGKLLDESGRPLTPSHAVKGERRLCCTTHWGTPPSIAIPLLQLRRLQSWPLTLFTKTLT